MTTGTVLKNRTSADGKLTSCKMPRGGEFKQTSDHGKVLLDSNEGQITGCMGLKDHKRRLGELMQVGDLRIHPGTWVDIVLLDSNEGHP